MNQTRFLILEEVGYCRLFAAVATSTAEWLRCVDAWDVFLRLDSSSPLD